MIIDYNKDSSPYHNSHSMAASLISSPAPSITMTKNTNTCFSINIPVEHNAHMEGTLTAKKVIVTEDVMIGQHSVLERLTKIEQRLNIIQHNQELEQRWAELKQLGDRYRQLETELLEKEKMWNMLKST